MGRQGRADRRRVRIGGRAASDAFRFEFYSCHRPLMGRVVRDALRAPHPNRTTQTPRRAADKRGIAEAFG